MTKPLSSILLALCIASSSVPADQLPITSPVKPSDSSKNVKWQNDPLCQFVFFAVLEGLYRDGVQNEVVDLIIGKPIKAEGDKVKSVFVFRCELCHATYEAFRTYRARPAFRNTSAQTTFGEGVKEKYLEELKSKDAQTRVYSMGRLVRPWIMHRIEETRKTDKEKAALKKEFERYAKDGALHLHKHQENKDRFYLDWDFYGTCQACEAAEDLGKQ